MKRLIVILSILLMFGCASNREVQQVRVMQRCIDISQDANTKRNLKYIKLLEERIEVLENENN